MVNIKLIEGKGFVDLDKPEEQAKITPEQIAELVNKSYNVQAQVIAKIESLPNFDKQIQALKTKELFKDLAEALSPLTIYMKPEETRPLSAQVKAISKNEQQQVQEEKPEMKKKPSKRENLEGLLGFLPGGNNNEPEPAPQPIYNPLVCQHCGAKLKPNWTRCNNCGAPVTPKTQYKIPEWIKPHQTHALDFFAGLAIFVIWIAASGWMLSAYGLSWGSIIGLGVFWIVFVVVYRVVTGGILD